MPRADLPLFLMTFCVVIPLSEARMVSLPCGPSQCLVLYLGGIALTPKRIECGRKAVGYAIGYKFCSA